MEVWGNSAIKRDHIYIKDVLRAVEASITSGNAKGIYNIATGVGYSQLDEARTLSEVFMTTKKSEVVECPEKPGLNEDGVIPIEVKAGKEKANSLNRVLESGGLQVSVSKCWGK